MKNKNLIDKHHEADMVYFVLGSLISADSLIDVEACHKASDCRENLKRDFEMSKLKDGKKMRFFLVIAGEIEQEIIQAGREIPQEIWAKNHWYASSFDDSDRTYPTYERKNIDIMKRGVYVLRLAHIYAQRIDWMLSGDDNEESLAKRLDEELRALKAKYPGGKFTFKRKERLL